MLTQLRRVPFFRDFPEEDLEEVSKQLQYRAFEQGEVVFAEGTPGDALYLLESGQVRVVSGAVDQRQVLATLGPGDYFGEMALLTNEPRSAAVVTAIDSAAWVLKKADFDRLLVDHPSIAVTFARVLSRRLSQIDRQLSTAPRPESGERFIAIVGEHAGSLARSLARQTGERVLLFDLQAARATAQWSDWLEAVHAKEGYDALECPRDLPVDRLAHVLGALTEAYDRILLQVPSHQTEHGLLALSHAEAVIPLGAGEPAGGPGSWVRSAAGDRLWQPAPAASGTDRLARRIARRTVGLALSSGSAHGLAHIGVLSVLEEHGVPVDMIAGASIGSLVGAIYATGKGLPALLSFADESAYRLSRRGGLWDYAIPFQHGLIRGQRVLRYIRELVGGATFESLATPLHVVAAELISGREMVLNSGPVAEAVRASISIPGLFEPFFHAGHYYVDGGAANPVPCSVLARHGANTIIAVNVTAEPEERVRRGVRSVGRQGAGNRGMGIGRRGGRGEDARAALPSIVEALLGSLEMMEYEIAKTKSQPVSVLIQPKTGMYDSMAAEHAPELIRAGEVAARERMGQIQALLAPRRRAPGAA